MSGFELSDLDVCVCCLCVAGFCSGETDLLRISVETCRWWCHRLRHTARQPQDQKVSFCAAFSLDQVVTRYWVWLFFNPTSSEPFAEPLTSKIPRLVIIFQLQSAVITLKPISFFIKLLTFKLFWLKSRSIWLKLLKRLKHVAQSCIQSYQCHWLFQSIAKPAEWKYQSGVCSSWGTVSCCLNVDMLLPLPDKAGTENMDACLKVGALTHTYIYEYMSRKSQWNWSQDMLCFRRGWKCGLTRFRVEFVWSTAESCQRTQSWQLDRLKTVQKVNHLAVGTLIPLLRLPLLGFFCPLSSTC